MSPVLDLLARLVKYDTRTNENTPGKEVLQLIQAELEPKFKEFGFESKIFESNGHYSIYAEKAGLEPKILYSGHVDVVPWDDRWKSNPQELIFDNEDGEEIVRGRGVSDMKCGIAALMTALPKIAQSKYAVSFALTGDEEIAGEDGTKVIVDDLVENGKLPTYVITADAAGMEIITRRRNVFDIFVKSREGKKTIVGKKETKRFTSKIVSAKTSHAAYYKKDQDNHCVKEAAEFINKNGYYPIDLKGNFVKVNVIPDSLELTYIVPTDEGEAHEADLGLMYLLEFARNIMDIDFETEAFSEYGINSTGNVLHHENGQWSIEVDIRAMLNYEARELDGAILLILDSIDWNFELQTKKSIGFIATPDDSPLAAATTELLGSMGYPSKTAERGGATDGRFFAFHEVQTVDIGAIGWNVHGPNETSTVKSIEDLVTFFEKATDFIGDKYNQQ